MPPRTIRDVDVGLKTLVNPSDAKQDVLAVHGRGAHPDDTWCQLREHGLDPRISQNHINWLSDGSMLPDVIPTARIMRFGYRSAWFGAEKIITSPKEISTTLLTKLSESRKSDPRRPLIIIAHSFGGLIVMQALVSAVRQYPDVFASLTGLVFFGTPFRGNGELPQQTLVQLAQESHGESYGRQLETSGNQSTYLKSLFDDFQTALSEVPKPKIACFYEQCKTNVSVVVNKGREERYVLWVNDTSATLDSTDKAIAKYPRDCHHLNLNKFRSPALSDFQTLARIMRDMVAEGPALLKSRSNIGGDFSLKFDLTGISSEGFIGRKTELAELRSALRNSKQSRLTAVLWGCGGIGKTQLAAAYAKRYRKSYSAVIWLDGMNESCLKSGFAKVARRINREHPASAQLDDRDGEAAMKVKDWLGDAANTNWLFICDNYSPNLPNKRKYDVLSFLPEMDHGAVIITCRLSDLNAGRAIHVGPISTQQDSLELLRMSSGCSSTVEDANAVKLADQLNGIPLALTTAGLYIRQAALSYKIYLKTFRQSWQEVPKLKPVFEPVHRRTLLAVWLTTFEVFKSAMNNDSSLRLLDAIDGDGQDDSKVASAFVALGELYSDKGSRSLLQAEDMYRRAKTALTKVAGAGDGRAITMSIRLARLYVGCQRLDQADPLLAKLRRKAETQSAMSQKSRCSILHQSGRLYLRQNKLPEAEEMFLKVIYATTQASHGSTREVKLSQLCYSLNALAALYIKQGRTEEAENHLLSALIHDQEDAIIDKKLVAELKVRLATLYRKQKRFAEAEPLLLQVSKDHLTAFDDDDALYILEPLGALYKDQGNFQEAKKVLVRALSCRENISGSDAWQTIQAVEDLGKIYVELNDLAQADTLFVRALAGSQQLYGLSSLTTLSIGVNLGRVRAMQGRMAEAKQWYDNAKHSQVRMSNMRRMELEKLREALSLSNRGLPRRP